jgi:phospholipid/cholesterol/gamma-HCH transport system substrate-binding protein
MQILRNEVRTGLLVILTIGLVVGLVLYISSPGLFRPLKTFHVYFDNAAGIKPGAAVMLAGRKIGNVAEIQSPVPFNDRPPNRQNFEAMVSVEVSGDAQIYKETTVSMRSFGLLAELVVDFTNGNPDSGLADANYKFAGNRFPDLAEVGPAIIQKLDPTLKQAETALVGLQKTLQNLTILTDKNSVLTSTLKNFDAVGGNLKEITNKSGTINTVLAKVQDTLTSVQGVTAQLQKDRNLEKTLANFDTASIRLKTVLDRTDQTFSTALPLFDSILQDVKELTSKLKQQPWRIVWPSTIKYSADNPEPPVSPRRRKSASQ